MFDRLTTNASEPAGPEPVEEVTVLEFVNAFDRIGCAASDIGSPGWERAPLQCATVMDDRDTSAEESSVKPGFDTIVEEHSDFVYNLALRMMGSPEDAEDVAQDAFISAYRAYGRFRGDSRVTTWLYRITTNAALMKLRKEKRARELTQTGLDNVEVASWEPTPERQALTSELGDKLMDGIDSLPPDLRAAVILRDVEQLSNAEAADVLDVTVSSFKSRLHRARVLLRNHLAEFSPG